MALRLTAISAALFAVLAGTVCASVASTHRVAPSVMHLPTEGARACLVSGGQRCLALSPKPFAPCLLVGHRCGGDWSVEGLQPALRGMMDDATQVGSRAGAQPRH